MKLEHRSLSRLAVPLKALVDRFAFGTLIVASIALLIVGKADVRILEAVNTRISDLLAPALEVVVQPINASRRMARTIGELVALRAENVRLREQNERLLEWQGVARQLALENAALRQLLSANVEDEHPTAVTARVVADAGGPFVQTVIVNAGADQGVAKGMAAVNERGLVGRVIEVGRRSARILLLTDFNSRVPVMVEPSRDQAILAGDNSREPGLTFLPLNPRLSVGDRVVTSGRGGVLPPGLAIGVVSRVDEHKVAVRPLVDWDRLAYLRLLEYARVLPPEKLEELQQEIFGPPPPPGHAVGALPPTPDGGRGPAPEPGR
ncbi:MAG: cell shape-determining protein MreC [Geminicoccaceae bacterium]|nr:cell shape-determining protein MreC [Geminicoccaceae bacterium]MCE3247591.1 cell shape-determining protein MreC [Geminicoccaceae bacterium]